MPTPDPPPAPPDPPRPGPEGPRTPYPVNDPDITDVPGTEPDYVPGKPSEPGTM